MQRHSIAACLLCVPMVLAASVSFATGFTIAGVVAGADERPPIRADVTVHRYGEKHVVATVRADSTGAFTLRVPELGAFTVTLSAVGHQPLVAPLVIEHAVDIDVSIRLAAYDYRDTLDSVFVIGDFNRFEWDTKRTMERRPDGTFALEVPVTGDSVAYQIVGAERSNRSVNGTMSQSNVPDETGDYKSVIHPAGATTTIVFDPRRVLRSANPAEAIWAPRAVARWMTVCRWIDSAKARTRAAVTAAAGDTRLAADAADSALRRLDSAIQSERDALSRRYLSMMYVEVALGQLLLGTNHADSAIVQRAIAEIRPTSALWTLSPGLVVAVVALLGESPASHEYLDRVLARHPSAEVRAAVLFNAIQLSRWRNDTSTGVQYYDRLVAEYPESRWAALARESYAPDRAVMEGKPAPEFHATDIDDSTVAYDNTRFKGRYVLVDFWAVWCKPCVAEMQNLRTAFEKYRELKLDFLSVSFDRKPADVARFRRGPWAMPWLHTFAAGGFDSPLAKAFDVRAIPKPILIGPDGTIVATDLALRGSNLDKTLAKHLLRAER